MTKAKQLYIRPPFPGAVVRDPETLKPLPAEGMWVVATPHWRRQIKLGEVQEAEAPAQDVRSAGVGDDGCKPGTTLPGEATSPTASGLTGSKSRAMSKEGAKV